MKALFIYTTIFILGFASLLLAAPTERDEQRGCIASAYQATKNGFPLDLSPCDHF
jgi:hypothetical protein